MLSSPASNHPRRRAAFTLIELLVVIAIIALLVSILLPSLNQAKDLARSVVCQSNLNGIGKAFSLYAADWDGVYPAGYPPEKLPNGDPWPKRRKYQWFHVLRDYTDKTSGGEHSDIAQEKNIFRCPLAQDFLPERATWALFAVSYAANNAVLGDEEWIAMSSIEKSQSQMALADWFLGAEVEWSSGFIKGKIEDGNVDELANDEVWWGEDVENIFETPSEAYLPGSGSWKGRVVPMHGNAEKANLLMADGHVEANVTDSEGRKGQYQNPTADLDDE